MIRHISMFFLKDEKEELRRQNAERLVKLLENLLDEIPEILRGTVGSNLSIPPQVLEKSAPAFADVVQIIDFKDRKAANEYPSHPAHLRLLELTDDWMEQVAAIDFEIQED